jgi:predicted MFS family arabinose efflux permease
LVNDIIPPKDIRNANAVFASTFAVIHIIGPLVGATAFAYFKGVNEILFFDLATYAVGIWLLSRMSYRPPSKPQNAAEELQKKTGMLDEIRDGLAFVSKRPDMRALLFNGIVTGFCIGILIPLMLPFVKDVLGHGEQEYGHIMAIFGLGGALGSALSSKICTRFHIGKVIVFMALIEMTLMMMWSYNHSLVIGLFLFFVWGIAVFTRITAQLNYVSATVETAYLTRVLSLIEMSFVVPSISGGLVVALLGNQLSVLEIMQPTAWGFAIVMSARFFTRGQKELMSRPVVQVERDESSFDHLN